MRREQITAARRTVNVKRNIVYGLLQSIISRVLPFIVRTILIYRFGVEYLGLNSLFTSILSVLSLMELGFGNAVVYSIYKPIAAGDTDQICAYLNYYRKICCFIGLSILAAGLVLIPFLKYLVNDPALPGRLNLYLCYLIFLGNTVISYLLYGYMSVIPIAFQRRDFLSRIDMVMSMLACILKSFILLTVSSFYLFLISMPLLTATRNLLIAHMVKGRYPDLKCEGDLRLEQIRELHRKVTGIFINRLTDVSRNSIDSLCISSMIGLSVTGIYSNYYYIMLGVLSAGGMICHSMMASVGNSIATESRQKNYADMRLFDFIYMTGAGWAVSCLLCLYQPFIMIWIGEEMMFGIGIVEGLCVYSYILLMGNIRWVYHEGAGLWWECRYIMIGESAANLAFNIVLCRIWGVAGIVLATILSVFVTNVLLCPKLIFRLYFRNGRLWEYWTDHVWYAVTMLLTAGTCWALCNRLFPLSQMRGMTGFACLAGRLVICTASSAGVFWLVWHRSKRYKKAVEWLKWMKKV